MNNPLDGGRQRLDDQATRGVDFRAWIMLAILLAAIGFAVWRHAG